MCDSIAVLMVCAWMVEKLYLAFEVQRAGDEVRDDDVDGLGVEGLVEDPARNLSRKCCSQFEADIVGCLFSMLCRVGFSR